MSIMFVSKYNMQYCIQFVNKESTLPFSLLLFLVRRNFAKKGVTVVIGVLFKVNVKCDLLLWKNHFLHARCHTPFSLTPVSGMLYECSCQPPTSSNIENWLGVADRWHHITHRTWCHLCKKKLVDSYCHGYFKWRKTCKKDVVGLRLVL